MKPSAPRAAPRRPRTRSRACSAASPSTSPPMPATNAPGSFDRMALARYKAITAEFFEAFRAKDLARVRATIHPKFVDHDRPPGTSGEGHDYIDQFCQAMWRAFPDLTYEMHDLFGEGNRV